MPQYYELLKCESYKAANIIMIHIPDHIVEFYIKNRARATTETTKILKAGVNSIHQKEREALSYVAGYIVSKHFQKN